ncbi:MAG: ribonuclease HII [Peptococcaceae bacterium]|nr:ribonuclease HII [Peptococcaceae bacterium]
MLKPDCLTINEVKLLLQDSPTEEFIRLCAMDERQGVRRLAESYGRQLERQHVENARLEKLYILEEELWQQGYTNIVGIDEVGRGPLAGPVVAGAVIFPGKLMLDGLNDSKRVPENKRHSLAREIRHKAIGWSIGLASVEEIDELNILGATKLAMARAVDSLGVAADYLLIDAIKLAKLAVPQKAIIGGDGLSASIAAASILAKVYRDDLMHKLHVDYPCYNFAANKGYLTPEHASALKAYGHCAVHRTSFEPVRTVRAGNYTV